MARVARTAGQKTTNGLLIRLVREATLWVLGAMALIMLLALLTYDPRDPGFSHTGDGGMLHNQIGAAGAWFADFAYYLCGLPAFLFPAMMLLAGWVVFSERTNPRPMEKKVMITRFGGFVIMLLTSCGLATLHFPNQEMRESAGGVLGKMVGTGLEGVLGLLGATLLLLALWLAAVSLFTGISWLAVMDRIGYWVLRGGDATRLWLKELRDRAMAQRVQHRRQSLVRAQWEKKAKQPPPRIDTTVPGDEPGTRAEQERQVPLFDPPAAGALPPLSLLDAPPVQGPGYSREALEAMSRLVELKLRDFGVEVDVVAVHPGPIVTCFELNPAPGVKVSQISNLSKDIARSLSVVSVRVVEIIPGKSVVGLEIPNEGRELVTLGEILKSKIYEDLPSPLTLALGKDISGKSVVADLARMPHLLIAGTTGSGKSVGLNAMVLSLLYKSNPAHVRMIMIDPKMVELSVYEGIPHLLCPVVTDMKDAANALRWCVVEVERRYRLMAALKVRNIGGYNRKVHAALDDGQPIADPLFAAATNHTDDTEAPVLQPLPNIVVVVDELADMMMLVGKKVEQIIARLAQKARAAGLHMIIATQRPSVDVITGLIKANIPCRIAFQVSAKVDSRTILDQIGAENLLGHGDMLFLPPGVSTPVRVHGAFVSDQEVHRVVQHLRASGEPIYLDEVTQEPVGPIPGERSAGEVDGETDALYDQAVQIVIETRRASISGIQRRLKIGYNRAARMVETMEQAGIVGALQSNGTREVLVPASPDEI